MIKPEFSGVYVTKTQTAYRDLNKENPFDSGARDAVNFLSSLETFEQRLQYFPGKKIFGQFVQILQDQYGINMRLDEIISVLKYRKCP